MLVALVPQGLVVMVTVTYALAIVRLAGGKALIQRSNAVESMSRVDVLCLDKTGTLTTPQIEVAEVQPFADEARAGALRWATSWPSATLATRSADALRAAYTGTRGRGRRGGDVLVRAALERPALTRSGARLRARRARGRRAARRARRRRSRSRSRSAA